jgi:uncharacterized protein with FMN-binding domain
LPKEHLVKRAPIVVSATVVGLAATLGFRAHAPAAPTPSTAQVAPSPAPRASSTPGTAKSSSSSSSRPSTSSATKTVTSAVETNRYGNVQLKVTIKSGKITSIQVLQIPQNDGKSAQINAYAEPILRQSALAVQSASIDAVSGATYTSDSYKTALQSVLDQVQPSSTASTGASANVS